MSASRSSSATGQRLLHRTHRLSEHEPASQSEYHSAPASSASGARRRPPCSNITSTSEPGHSSPRAYDPSATIAHPDAVAYARAGRGMQRVVDATPRAWAELARRADRDRRPVPARASRARRSHRGRYRASGPDSPVRMRQTLSTGTTHTLPSPIFPVRSGGRAAAARPGRVTVVDEHVDPHLGHEVDRVLRAPVHLGVAPLASEALHLGDREPLHAELLEGVLHVVDLERLDDPDDASSGSPSLRDCVCGVRARPVRPGRARTRPRSAARGRGRSPRPPPRPAPRPA